MSSRPLRAIIDLGALRNNVALTKEMSGEACVFGVVKADGYAVSYTHLTLPTKRIV